MPRKKSDGTDEPETEALVARPGHVLVTVTKFGEGKVSTGEHIAEQGDVMAQKGDILECPEDQAKIQEALGLVEINA